MKEATPYRPDAADLLWLSRAVEAEGAPERIIAQALVNRFVWLRATRGRKQWPTLRRFVRLYASPVNPRRMRGGDIWERIYRSGDESVRKRLEASDRRRRAHSERVSFRRATVEAVSIAITRGPVDLPDPLVTDYAAHWLGPASHLRLIEAGRPGVNALYAVRGSSWGGYSVRLDGVSLIAPLWLEVQEDGSAPALAECRPALLPYRASPSVG